MLGTRSPRTSSLLPTSPPKSQFPLSPLLPLDTQLSPVTPLVPLDTKSRHLPPYPAFRNAQPKPQISPISRKHLSATRPRFLPLASISVKISPVFPVNSFPCHTFVKSRGGGGGYLYTNCSYITSGRQRHLEAPHRPKSHARAGTSVSRNDTLVALVASDHPFILFLSIFKRNTCS